MSPGHVLGPIGPASLGHDLIRWAPAPFRILGLSALMILSACEQPQAPSNCALPIATLHAADKIAIEGDSLIYGFDATETGHGAPINASQFPRSRAPIPETLQDLFDGRVSVENRGFPGDRSSEGLLRWHAAPTTSWTLIMFGTNDFGNYGHYESGPVPVDRFAANLRQLARRRLDAGGHVLFLLPPPMADRVADGRLDAYRIAMRRIATELGLCYVDTGNAVESVSERWTDGIHLSQNSNIAISNFIRRTFIFGE